MIRAILLDDNESHLSLMEEELKTYSKIIEVIGAYTKWHEAIPEIMASKPDVLFLDVEMPGKTGFEVAATVKDICSNVIYVTDYMKYAPQSYSVNAIFFIDKK